ncbi:putative P-loop ATPase fused to an acetyltransferase [Thioflavicoccus mobilis 8321]|uniref:tRNA(Met) cytidine acetyltransferase TmcA n=1 Tax=Thioflavicoccus mobilis 8321 TaxID=765912 RepID=L0GYN6_9GAMM|nr:GNAT family N-acetyltransferase [Thioflavicoccus mobilis]AGA91066.1 putative P-loop ATPase fused to an acetyltransferase [Thioflavicoccus mobilis 8321]
MQPDPEDAAFDALAALAQHLRQRARAARHRLALVLAGDAAWTLAAASAATADSDPLWLSDRAVASLARPLAAAGQLLGQELDALVYDAHGGLDPDGLGAAAGTLRGGGLLVLLTPPLADWPQRPDPQARRIAVHPFTPADVGGRFIARLVRVLETDPGCLIVHQGRPLPALPPADGSPARPADRPVSPARAATADQQRAIEAILKTARGRARRPLVITADRGRGKTAALGFAAGDLLAAGATVLVTAPRRAAVEPLFRHATAALPEAETKRDGLAYRQGRLIFIAPDALDLTAPPAELLIVDEAAGIPAPLLARALARYRRLVFATTIHGYEGTGRGFEVRFRATLDRLTPHWRALTLEAPIRWAPHDPLEALIARALLLEAAPAPREAIADITAERCVAETLDRDALVEDEATLAELFGLLVLAHYQTRPLDLRHLLDGPNVRVSLLRDRETVVATALTADEGNLEADLTTAVFAGQRRPRGHLLPQTLCAHAGLAVAPRLRYRRIVRLAVHPALARRGLGRRLLETLCAEAQADGIDLVGASFGATPELIGFWDRCGFTPVQLGTRRNAASGEHALVVLRPLSEPGDSILAEAGQRLAERLPRLLPGPLRQVSPATIAALLATLPGRTPRLDANERCELASFATERRALEPALPLLIELASARLGPTLRQRRITAELATVVVGAILQMRTPTELGAEADTGGRTDLVVRLRRAAELLLLEV